MGWIIKSIAFFILEFVSYMIGWSVAIIRELKLDIGIPDNINSLSEFQFIDPATVGEYGLLAKTFPGAESYGYLFLILAELLVFLVMMFKLYQGFLSPLSTSAEGPISVVANCIIASFGVFASYSIFVTLEIIFNKIYVKFMNLYNNQISQTGFERIGGNGDKENVFGYIEFYGAKLIDPKNSGNISGTGGFDSGDGFGLLIIEVMIGIALVVSFLKLVVEIYQRYITLGLLFYTCPLAFAMLSSKQTKEVMTNWIQMVLSQFILMCMNLFFVGTFIMAMDNILFTEEVINEGKAVFETDVKFVTTMLLLIAWLIVGQKVDEYMRGLGLSIANTGNSLAGAVAGAAMSTYTIMKGVGRAGTKVMNGIGNIVKDHRNNDGKDLGQQAENFMGGINTAAENEITKKGLGKMNGNDFKDNVLSRADSLGLGDKFKNGDLNYADINWDNSASLSGEGLTTLVDDNNNVLIQSAIEGSPAAQYLEDNDILRQVNPNGSITPITQGMYDNKVNDLINKAGNGRLPNREGNGIDNTRYKQVGSYDAGVLHLEGKTASGNITNRDINIASHFNMKGNPHNMIKNNANAFTDFYKDHNHGI